MNVCKCCQILNTAMLHWLGLLYNNVYAESITKKHCLKHFVCDSVYALD